MSDNALGDVTLPDDVGGGGRRDRGARPGARVPLQAGLCPGVRQGRVQPRLRTGQ